MAIDISLSKILRSLTARFWTARQIVSPRLPPTDSGILHQAYRQLHHGRRDIETKIDDPALATRLVERVIGQWQKLGDADPFWSNDTREEFKRDNLTEDRIQDFYEGGKGVAPLMRAFESRSDISIINGVCVELGCGVGKHTHVLAERFKEVFAIDVSAASLAICAQQMKRLGVENVTTMLLTSPNDLGKCGKTDFFFSLSVLQHNPPPIQRLMLDQALNGLRPGGCCLFQTPDWIEGYSFSSERFVSEQEAMFDLHCLPKIDVLSILEGSRMRLLDFAPDFTLGSFGSYTYFARKDA